MYLVKFSWKVHVWQGRNEGTVFGDVRVEHLQIKAVLHWESFGITYYRNQDSGPWEFVFGYLKGCLQLFQCGWVSLKVSPVEVLLWRMDSAWQCQRGSCQPEGQDSGKN